MRILNFEMFLEMIKVETGRSGTGMTRQFDLIFSEIENPKTLAHMVALNDKLKKLELSSMFGIVANKDELGSVEDQVKLLKRLKLPKNSEKALRQLKIALNNQKFLYSEKEKGSLNCAYCHRKNLKIYDFTKGQKFRQKDGATCDHKVPMSKGGDKYDFSNMAVSCYFCNNKKGNMDFDEWISKISIQ